MIARTSSLLPLGVVLNFTAPSQRKGLPEVRDQADLDVGEARSLATAGLDVRVLLGSREAAPRDPERVSALVFASSGADGAGVGRLDLDLDPRGRVVQFPGQTRPRDGTAGTGPTPGSAAPSPRPAERVSTESMASALLWQTGAGCSTPPLKNSKHSR